MTRSCSTGSLEVKANLSEVGAASTGTAPVSRATRANTTPMRCQSRGEGSAPAMLEDEDLDLGAMVRRDRGEADPDLAVCGVDDLACGLHRQVLHVDLHMETFVDVEESVVGFDAHPTRRQVDDLVHADLPVLTGDTGELACRGS